MVLEIKQRDDVPFGELLLSKSEIHIESKKWKTPLNYIFAKLFNRGLLHEELRNAAVDDLPGILAKSRETVHLQILSKCLVDYFTRKLQENAVFATDLARTGSSPLECNVFPKNIYGKLLEQCRNSPRDQQPGDDRSQDPIYYMYLASKALKEILSENNLEEFLDQKFKRMSDLLRALQERYGRERIFRKAPDRETILKIHKQLEVDYTTNPSTLIRLVRRKHIRRVRQLAEVKIKTIVFDEFVNSVRHLHPALPEHRDAVINKEKLSIDVKKNIQLMTRANLLWNERKLPSSVMQRIDEKVKRIYMPSDEEIQRYESDVFLLYPGSEVNNNQTVALQTTVTIDRKSHLHPYSVDHLKMEDGVTYPTCIHYYVVQTILHEDAGKQARDLVKKLVKYETHQLIEVLEKWRRKHRQELFDNIVDQTLYIYFKDVRRQHLLLCTGQETLALNCPLVSNLSVKMMKIRSSITPKIYRVTSLDHIKEIYLVQEWCKDVEELLIKLQKLITSWLRDKGSEKTVGLTELIQHFFHGSYRSLDELTTGVMGTFRKFGNDLAIVNFILKKQYWMSNKWVKPPNFVGFTACARDNMALFALCQLLLAFDRIVDVPVTLNDVDVGHAKAILTHYIKDEQEFLDSPVQEEEENDNYDEDEDNEAYDDDYDNLEFEGNDVIFKHLQLHAFNGLSDYIETSLYQCLKTINVQANRNRINFFAGIIL